MKPVKSPQLLRMEAQEEDEVFLIQEGRGLPSVMALLGYSIETPAISCLCNLLTR